MLRYQRLSGGGKLLLSLGLHAGGKGLVLPEATNSWARKEGL